MSDDERIKQAFRVFDADNSGTVSAAELRAILSRGDNPLLTEDDIAEVISSFDANGDGELSISEFAAALSTVSDGEAEAIGDKIEIKMAFDAFDADKDGVLSRSDLSSILMKQQWDDDSFEPMLTEAEMSEVLSGYGNGEHLTYSQFEGACSELTDAEAGQLKARMDEVIAKQKELIRMGANRPVQGGSEVAEDGATIAAKTHFLIVALDYKKRDGYNTRGTALTCSIDADRFVSLAKECGCDDVVAITDKPGQYDTGHPSVENITAKWREMADRCSAGDTFMFFYSGHGSQRRDASGDEADGKDEVLCCTTPAGKGDYLQDDTLCDLIKGLPDGVKMLSVIDACHSGTPTDVETHDYGGRQVMHIGAVSDKQVASDVGEGGALSGSILESLSTIACAGVCASPPSVVDVYNWVVARYGASFQKKNQCVTVGKTKETSVSTFAWPFFPPGNYDPQTPMARRGERNLTAEYLMHFAKTGGK